MNEKSGGISFVGLLQIVFIILKLLKIITWSWWLVLLPIEISGGVTLLLIGILFWIKRR